MNKLPTAKRVTILSMLVGGMSMRYIGRIVGVSINTVSKLLVDAGRACAKYHGETVRDVNSRRVQCQLIWSFGYAKQKNVPRTGVAGAGAVWTWTALDFDSKLIIAYQIGDRSSATAVRFMDDLRARLANRDQLTVDGHGAYLESVEGAFGGELDNAQLAKLYGTPTGEKHQERKYSSGERIGMRTQVIERDPDRKYMSTPHVERHILTKRRLTRRTDAFSNKMENHLHMLNLYFVHYNFCCVHRSLEVNPAMEAGLTNELRDMEWIVGLIDERAPKPGPRALYKKRSTKT